MLGVNVKWDNEQDARKFVEEYGVPYRVGRDADGDIGRRYKVEGTPASFLINKDGTLFGQHQGAMTEEEFKRNIDALLGKKRKE